MDSILSNPLLSSLTGLLGLSLGLIAGWLSRSKEVKRLESLSRGAGCWVKGQVLVNYPKNSEGPVEPLDTQ